MKKIFVAILTILIIFTGCAQQKPYEVNVTAMGTLASYKLYGENSQSAFKEIDGIFSDIDNACSITKEGSAINKLNMEYSSDNPYIVEQASLFEKHNLLEISKGSFDLTAGALTSLWDIGFSGNSVPENIAEALKNVDGTKTKVENNVYYIGENQKIDLGAVTKGYALDKAKAVLEKYDTSGVVTLGGSVLFYGENPSGGNWRCAIKNPFSLNEYLGTFTLKEGFVSTSGSYERFFTLGDKTYHHIIDALDGYPYETDIVSVTVICDNGFLSDALSTICFILGVENSKSVLESFNASAVFVNSARNITILGEVDFEAY